MSDKVPEYIRNRVQVICAIPACAEGKNLAPERASPRPTKLGGKVVRTPLTGDHLRRMPRMVNNPPPIQCAHVDASSCVTFP